MIILTKAEAEQIRGQYTAPYVLEPIALEADKYALPEAVMTNPAYRDAWAFLKTKPVELITSDEMEGISYSGESKPKEALYEIKGVEMDFKVWEINKLSRERGEIKLTAIKNGLHRDITLNIDKEITFELPGVGEITAVDAMLAMDAQGKSSKQICEMLIPMREKYINETWFLKYE